MEKEASQVKKLKPGMVFRFLQVLYWALIALVVISSFFIWLDSMPKRVYIADNASIVCSSGARYLLNDEEKEKIESSWSGELYDDDRVTSLCFQELPKGMPIRDFMAELYKIEDLDVKVHYEIGSLLFTFLIEAVIFLCIGAAGVYVVEGRLIFTKKILVG